MSAPVTYRFDQEANCNLSDWIERKSEWTSRIVFVSGRRNSQSNRAEYDVRFATDTDAMLFTLTFGEIFKNPRLVADDAEGGPH